MKKVFLNIVRCIVGCETGFAGEGNQHWYYFLSLVINIMLVWWLNPQIALVFTILSVIHYATIFIYGYFGLSEDCLLNEDSEFKAVYVYLAIHLTLIAVAFLTNWKWSLITIGITVFSIILTPDEFGENIFFRTKLPFYNGSHVPLLFHSIIFVAFVVIDFLLPIKLWIKILIIVGMWMLHPLIDFLEGECVEPIMVTCDTFDTIRNRIGKGKKR